MRILFLFIFIIFLMPVTWAADNCDFNLVFPNVTILITENQQVIQHDFTLERGEESPHLLCQNYRIFFSKGQSNSYQRKAFGHNNSGINYNIHRLINMAGILKDYGDAANSNEFIDGIAQNRNVTYTNRLFVSVPSLASQNFPRSGNYTDIIQASIYGRVHGSNLLVYSTSRTFSVTYVINKKIEVSVVDEGAPFDASSTSKVLDFGFLTQNSEKKADLRIVSNTPYQVKLTSMNNGHLKHTQGALIDYSLKVNGSNTNLSTAPTNIGCGNETTTVGDRYQLKFKITDTIDNKLSGLYQDVITITAIAN